MHNEIEQKKPEQKLDELVFKRGKTDDYYFKDSMIVRKFYVLYTYFTL